jgi:NADH-quinone oxidoreductase subunit F
MNIDQIRAAAETQFSHLNDPRCIKILVSSSAADPNADHICILLQNAINQFNLPARIVRTGSLGCYDFEPVMIVDSLLYNNASPDRVADLINDLINRKSAAPHVSELPLFNLQSRIALRNCGWIDPENIDHYIVQGQGYSGFSNALKLDPPDLAETLIQSAFKGRGGQGCSALENWKSLHGEAGKYLVCNAVDPDPQSLASRLLLESDPHSVLEGMLISAYAAGVSKCSIFLEEKTEAGKRLGKALDQMKKYNLLGLNILDSQFCTEIEIMEAPASLLSGYRIELCRCLENNQPVAHMLPDFPAASEFSGKPVLIANPEMMSSLSAAVRAGAKAGGESKIVTLSGSVVHKHTVEVPSGTTIRNIIEYFGGGVSNGKTIKAVQFGSPAGRFVAPDSLDEPIGLNPGEEYSSIDVLDSDSCIVNAAKEIMSYIQAQSCGKCVFCREGCLQMLIILEGILEKRSKPQDLDLLVDLGEEMRTSCLCAFGRTAPIPVLSGIKLFRAEYESRVSSFQFPVSS